ncbi:MAG TPA: OmpA family protein [Bacteroidales bacterium]|jgi:outer membrane protein OmpA-like peptidoglycan-associated protein|nr:OmpA family protein [Bacteroidales bacterium]
MILKHILFLSFFLSVLDLTAQRHNDIFVNKFLKAEQLIEKGDFPSALVIYKELLAEEQDNANINFKTGFCYLNTVLEKTNAIEYLEKAVQDINSNADIDDPDELAAPPEALYFLAKAYHHNYQFTKALQIIDSLKQVIPNYKKDFTENVEELEEYCKNGQVLMKYPIKMQITNLGGTINTEYDEHSPVFSADEQVLIFTSKRKSDIHPARTDDGQYYEDIYISKKLSDGQWETPVPISPKINTATHEASIGLSPDGQELYIYKDESTMLNPRDGNIYVSNLVGDEWTTPLNLNINTKYNENHASISADGQELFFTSDRPGGYGGLDIYIAKRLPNGEWSIPQNAGPKINTSRDEISPYIHPDGVTLFFSSKGHNSLGGFDIFFSIRDDSMNWNEPTNLGYPINTPNDDAFYVPTPDGARAYYASQQTGGIGRNDLYVITLPKSEEKLLTVMSGYITMGNGQLPENVTITVTDELTKKVIGIYTPNSKTGKYLFILKSGKRYLITVENDIFLPYTEVLDVSDSSAYQKIERPITLEPINIRNVQHDFEYHFKSNQTELSSEEGMSFIKIAKILNYLPEFSARIVLPKENDFPDLNEIRADILSENLTDKGIPLTRIQVEKTASKNPNVLNLFIIANDTTPPVNKLTTQTDVQIKNTDIKEPEIKESKSSLIIFPIYFTFDKHVCQANEENLNKLVGWLNKNKKAKLEIIGYTDNMGSDNYNIKLSKRRAEYVKKQLISLGISEKRITTLAMGKKNPVSTNETAEGRQLNRRVEFKVTNIKNPDIEFLNKPSVFPNSK